MALGTDESRGAAKPQAKRVFSRSPTCTCIVCGRVHCPEDRYIANYTLPDGDDGCGVSRAWSTARAYRRSPSNDVVSGCAPPSTRRAIRVVSSSIATASRRSSSVARQGAILDDGSVDFNRVVGDGAVEELVRRDRSPVRFEHPVAGRCGATAAEVLAQPRD